MNRIEEILREALHEAGNALPDDRTIEAAPQRKDRPLIVAAMWVIGLALAALPIVLLVAPDNSPTTPLGQNPITPSIADAIAECMAAKDAEEAPPPPRMIEHPESANQWRAAVRAIARQECESSVMADDRFARYFERYISPDEYAAVMVPCLIAQGVPAKALPDGGVSFEWDLPPDQMLLEPDQLLLQREAMYQCMVRYPIHPRFMMPLDDGQLRRLYDYRVGDLMMCLEAEGYTVASPPTFEAFIASHKDPGLGLWDWYPMDDPRLEHEEEWYRLNSVCPQSLPAAVLYGDE